MRPTCLKQVISKKQTNKRKTKTKKKAKVKLVFINIYIFGDHRQHHGQHSVLYSCCWPTKSPSVNSSLPCLVLFSCLIFGK